MKTRIALPVLDTKQQPRGHESLEAEDLGQGRYRLLVSPGLAEGLAAGDEIELAPQLPCGYRVLQRSGNLCVWFYFKDAPQMTPQAIDELRHETQAIGGYLDGGTNRTLVLTIPLKSGWTQIERAMTAAVERYPGSHWFYGNVYDVVDPDRPLNWWLD